MIDEVGSRIENQESRWGDGDGGEKRGRGAKREAQEKAEFAAAAATSQTERLGNTRPAIIVTTTTTTIHFPLGAFFSSSFFFFPFHHRPLPSLLRRITLMAQINVSTNVLDETLDPSSSRATAHASPSSSSSASSAAASSSSATQPVKGRKPVSRAKKSVAAVAGAVTTSFLSE